MEYIQFPSNIEDIKQLFYTGVSRLSSIFIPKSVKKIDWRAFNGTSIKKIFYEGTEEEWDLINDFSAINGLAVFYNQKKTDATYFSYKNVDYAINDRGISVLEVVGCQNSNEIIIPYSINDHDKEYIVSSIKDDFFKNNHYVSCVKYGGCKYQWDKINFGNNVDYLSDVNVIYYYDEEAENISELANCLYVDNASSLRIGVSNRVSIKMKNNCPIVGFQFEMELPKYFSIDVDEDDNAVQISSERTTPQKHNILEISQLNNGHYLIVCSSTSNIAFSANDGNVLSLNLKIDNNIEKGDHLIILHNTAVATANAEVFRITKMQCPVEVSSAVPGDANGDGIISITDVSTIANYLLGGSPAGFNAKAADTNKDGTVSITDVSTLASQLLGK